MKHQLLSIKTNNFIERPLIVHTYYAIWQCVYSKILHFLVSIANQPDSTYHKTFCLKSATTSTLLNLLALLLNVVLVYFINSFISV